MTETQRIIKWWLFVDAVLFLIACCLPAVAFIDPGFYSPAAYEIYTGFQCLTLVPIVTMFAAWWSNLILFLGWFVAAIGHRKELILVASVSCVFAGKFVFGHETGFHLLLGCWFWFASHILFLIGSTIIFFRSTTLPEEHATEEQQSPPWLKQSIRHQIRSQVFDDVSGAIVEVFD